jgi:hypothetical protein
VDDTPTDDKPMTDDELLQRLGASTDRIEALEAELKAIRDEEAALQTRKSTALAKVKTEREQRERMLREAATVRKIKRVAIARAAKIDRTNLYKILDRADASSDSTTE